MTGANCAESLRAHAAPKRVERGNPVVTRALRNHNVWLTVTYIGLLLLMARAQV